MYAIRSYYVKDDKGYSYIKISNGEYPKITAELQKSGDGIFIGPYISSYGIKQAVNDANKVFMLPTCTRKFPQDFGKQRPCLNFFIKQCMGVCKGEINNQEYNEIVSDAVDFIKGGSTSSIEKLTKSMNNAADELDFELAAKLRDRINAIKKINDSQKVIETNQKNTDVIARNNFVQHTLYEVIRLSSGTITAVGTTEEYQLAPVKLSTITVTQNGLTPTGFDGGSEFISRNINEPSNIYISMPATYVTVEKADNPLQVTCASFTYDGTTSATPNFTTNVPDVTFTYLNKDTNITYYGGGLLIDPGRYTVTVRTPATANYNAAEASADFEIFKADTLTVIFPTATQIAAGNSLQTSTLYGGTINTFGTFVV